MISIIISYIDYMLCCCSCKLYTLVNSLILNCIFTNYVVIDGVTVCGSRLWSAQEEDFKEALRAYILMFESNAELN